MIKALVIKELREVYWIAALALAVYLVVVSGLIGVQPIEYFITAGRYQAPFASDAFASLFGMISAGFAVVLGLRQSVWEGWQGLYQFLLHRPLRRDTIFLTKLATGAGLLLLCAAVPFLWYLIWAATPRHHPSPFEWSMTERAVRVYLTMPLLYLSAFLSGLRPAHWFGTRLLPLGAGLGFVILLVFALPWWLALPLAVLVYGVLVSAICYVGRTRDYA
jgi:hypothetical protein